MTKESGERYPGRWSPDLSTLRLMKRTKAAWPRLAQDRHLSGSSWRHLALDELGKKYLPNAQLLEPLFVSPHDFLMIILTNGLRFEDSEARNLFSNWLLSNQLLNQLVEFAWHHSNLKTKTGKSYLSTFVDVLHPTWAKLIKSPHQLVELGVLQVLAGQKILPISIGVPDLRPMDNFLHQSNLLTRIIEHAQRRDSLLPSLEKRGRRILPREKMDMIFAGQLDNEKRRMMQGTVQILPYVIRLDQGTQKPQLRIAGSILEPKFFKRHRSRHKLNEQNRPSIPQELSVQMPYYGNEGGQAHFILRDKNTIVTVKFNRHSITVKKIMITTQNQEVGIGLTIYLNLKTKTLQVGSCKPPYDQEYKSLSPPIQDRVISLTKLPMKQDKHVAVILQVLKLVEKRIIKKLAIPEDRLSLTTPAHKLKSGLKKLRAFQDILEERVAEIDRETQEELGRFFNKEGWVKENIIALFTAQTGPKK